MTTPPPPPALTNGHSWVRTHKVCIGLGDGPHSNLVEGPGQEAGKGWDKWHGSPSGSTADPDPNQILLGNEALDEPVREGILRGKVQVIHTSGGEKYRYR